MALRQTCLALADCAIYLIEHKGFTYVLLGSLQSDALEARFGWLRQLSGANYYISMRQVLESDRKIRVLSLLKFSAISLNDIDDAISNEAATSSESDLGALADAIVASLTLSAEPSDRTRTLFFT